MKLSEVVRQFVHCPELFGNDFNFLANEIAKLEQALKQAIDNAPTKQQVMDEFESAAVKAWKLRCEELECTIDDLSSIIEDLIYATENSNDTSNN